MHLVVKRSHCVTIPDIGEIEFSEGETIRTELSYKYDRSSVDDILAAASLRMEEWLVAADQSFALALARPKN
jgi:L-histidine N-alpha-methyltransferase